MKKWLMLIVLVIGCGAAEPKHVMIVWEGTAPNQIEDFIVLEEKNGMIHLQPARWNRTAGTTEATTDSPRWHKVSDIKTMTERKKQ